MNRVKSQTIYNLIKNACKEKGVPFTNAGYRRAKKLYNKMPRTIRHKVAEVKIVL